MLRNFESDDREIAFVFSLVHSMMPVPSTEDILVPKSVASIHTYIRGLISIDQTSPSNIYPQSMIKDFPYLLASVGLPEVPWSSVSLLTCSRLSQQP
jgi:hypothetical protein